MRRDYESLSQPFRPPHLQNNHSSHQANSPGNPLVNRWTLMAAGGALGWFALTRRSKTSTAVAAVGLVALTEAGVWSHQQNNGTSARDRARHHKAHASFAINCSAETAYNFWRDLENLPRFMQYLHSVKSTDGNRSEWTAIGPLNTKFRWSAQITEDRPNERIAWRSVEGSDIQTHGSVEFRPNPNGHGAIVRAKISYAPPAGSLGKTFAAILGKDPAFTVREDLRRFKALIETGEMPTTAGQPHGPRGVSGYAKAALLREHDNMPEAQAEMRRAG